jgi:uncharacterized protein
MKNILFILLGSVFGVILTKSEVISWFRIRKMFLFEEPHMYLIIGSAVVLGIISVLLLKKFKVKTLSHEEIDYSGKEYNKGFIYGGLIFGVGWAITGACPGPIFAQMGAGEYPAVFTFLGAIVGAFVYSSFQSKLPH